MGDSQSDVDTKTSSRVVLVTGGARGIGLGVAECFAEQGGAALALTDIDASAVSDAALQLRRMYGVPAIGIECDISQRSSVELMVRQVTEELGRIDVLINNAGVCPFIDALEMAPETFLNTVAVNLAGPFHCTQVVANQMIRQGDGGQVIFITSLNEHFTNAEQVDYASTKGGLRMQMKAFCLALGKHRIRCNAVAPGIMLTEMTAFHWEKPENVAYIESRVPAGRIGRPRDIGNACVFLASDAASYIQGSTITVDGGFSASCP